MILQIRCLDVVAIAALSSWVVNSNGLGILYGFNAEMVFSGGKKRVAVLHLTVSLLFDNS